MATRSQIDANRRNAPKSTGPRTPEGKSQSSANALKHGLAAGFRVLQAENQEEFDELFAGTIASSPPPTPTKSPWSRN
jgi:hypothetical protein